MKQVDRRRFCRNAAAIVAAGSLPACHRRDGATSSVPGAPPPPPPPPPPSSVVFPLRVGSSGRYLVDANGAAFFIHGDTAWSIQVQLDRAQVDAYLSDRAARGFTAILFETFERLYSSQSPAYKNVFGAQPFTTMSPVSWTSRVEAYWSHVDYIVNAAKARGMACFITPAYMGYNNNQNGDGWVPDTDAASAADLQNYGAFLASRYTQGNIVWVMGGDYAGSQAQRDKQWNIVTGLRSVRTDQIITGHPARTQDTYALWSSHLSDGFNLNSIYTRYSDNNEYGWAATAYAKPGPMPFFNIEALYEGEGGWTPYAGRRQAYVSFLSGACGHFFGNNPIWGFGEPNYNGGAGAASALANHLNTPGAQDMQRLRNLFAAYAWHLLQPRTDTSFVTTGLGSGNGRIVPACAGNGSFAMIWTVGAAFTLNMTALTAASVRARWFDPASGNFSAVSGSPFTNTGTRTFTPVGEKILVLDQ
jgi:Protein of unknown function (DUF4038)/Putative collagen-binding domain of a collagenase